MPSNLVEPPRSGRRGLTAAVAALLAGALLVVLGGCSVLDGDDDGDAAASPAARAVAAPDVAQAVSATLARRAAALLAADPVAFRADLARGAQFRRAQATYFANLTQLPLAQLRYTFDPAGLVRSGDDYWAVVELHLQLDGYDAVPVVSRDRYLFRPSPGEPARLRLASVTDRAWEARHDVRQQPWDLGPVVVREKGGVLGVFDQRSRAAAAALLGSVGRGIDEVSTVVPYEWSRTVVVYALSDASFLHSVPELPGGDPERVDGVAFPVPAAADDGTLAATRLVLHPRMLDRAGAERDRLLRHELTHVAVGERDDNAPVWLSEGIAEYVSVQPMAPEDRRLSASAVAAARAGVSHLPADPTFNGPDSAVHYGMAWWACEYLARSFDASVLFGLLDASESESGLTTDELLVGLLGVSEGRLARRAARLIIGTYA